MLTQWYHLYFYPCYSKNLVISALVPTGSQKPVLAGGFASFIDVSSLPTSGSQPCSFQQGVGVWREEGSSLSASSQLWSSGCHLEYSSVLRVPVTLSFVCVGGAVKEAVPHSMWIFHNQRLNPCWAHWEHGILSTGPLGSLGSCYLPVNPSNASPYHG